MILRTNQHKQMLWKNGGGITYEIDRQPNDNSDELHWRLSMASVKYPGGPFSIYPNIDRTLCVIDGENLTLKINNDDHHHHHQIINLNKNSPPYSFAGETSITCEIFEDTLTDFNVMTKRDQFHHSVRRFTFNKDQNPMNILNENKDIIFILVAQGTVQINQLIMTKGDVIKFIDDHQTIQISSSADNTIVYVVEIIKILS